MVLSGILRLGLAFLVAAAPAASSDLVCADHQRHRAAPADAGMPPEHQHDAAPKAPPCEQKTLAECCPMLMTCGISLLAQGGESAALVGFDPLATPLAPDAVLCSRAIPPDPPPPKL